EQLLFVERNPELVEGAANFGIDFVEAGERRPALRRGIVKNVLVVDRAVLDVAPYRLGHCPPDAVRLQPPLEQPRRLAFLLRNQADDVFAETARNDLLLDIGHEAVLVRAARELLNDLG